MFIELTLKHSKTKVMVNVRHVSRFFAMNPKDGYGNPQTGTHIHLMNGDTISVDESYEKVKELKNYVD